MHSAHANGASGHLTFKLPVCTTPTSCTLSYLMHSPLPHSCTRCNTRSVIILPLDAIGTGGTTNGVLPILELAMQVASQTQQQQQQQQQQEQQEQQQEQQEQQEQREQQQQQQQQHVLPAVQTPASGKPMHRLDLGPARAIMTVFRCCRIRWRHHWSAAEPSAQHPGCIAAPAVAPGSTPTACRAYRTRAHLCWYAEVHCLCWLWPCVSTIVDVRACTPQGRAAPQAAGC
jgi:hypothetical protein